MNRWLVVLLGMGACTPQAGGLGSTSALGSTTTGTTTTGPALTTSTTEAPSPDGSGGSGSSTSTSSSASSSTSSASSSDSSTSTGEPPLLASCAEILANDPAALTGTHTIARADDGMPMEVHCDMDLDDGGWTLVARSRNNSSSQSFGWKQSTGTLGDGSAPYSLDATRLDPSFTEILITRRMDFATPTDNAYVVTVPASFVEDFSDSQHQHAGARTVLGGCEPGGGPGMLSRVGYTDNDDFFYIRDNPDNQGFGLYPDGFRLNYDNCDNGGLLNGEQGALFVR